MKDCTQCGKCCIKYADGALDASEEEIKMWEIFQPHIAQYTLNGEIWVDPISGEKLSYCPFLQQLPNPNIKNQNQPSIYTCSIYYDRPEDCRHYPTSINEMIRDDCEMIEAVDLLDQTKAQKALDYLMRDSRPALK
ncbi:YkgJ family cysteine cluster protein [Marinicellulosiphila megalodicopiae]|uniref:YkgJ family cysteine cluster protein n=1 Tax=Marinicellulosiphila megalodicopiae TaxID=2724896 RepID=UPI003BAE92A1